jgi:hypothetical protein
VPTSTKAPTTPRTRKPVTSTTKKPVKTEPIQTTKPITRRPPITISKITTKPPSSVSTIAMRNRTETTRKPISSTLAESTITSQKIQADATTSSPSGLITWTVTNSVEENTTKGRYRISSLTIN